MFPIEKIRAKFPALSIEDNGVSRVYLDNPAGTQVPKSVANAIYNCLINDNANLGGHFITSKSAGKIVSDAHKAMADFLGADNKDEIIIGASTTTLAFHMSRSICRDFAPGDEIIVTKMDHEGNVSPWLEIAEDLNLKVRWLEFSSSSWQIEVDSLKKLITDRTRLLAVNYASNLTGMINDVKSLIAEAKKSNILTYVDAVQFAPHGITNVKELGCDFLTCSSYKFFGPHLGILWGKMEHLKAMHSYKCRTVDENDFPTKFETGTPAIELLAGLVATVNYYISLGEDLGASGSNRNKIETAFKATLVYEENLAKRLIAGLKVIDGIEIFGGVSDNQLKNRVPTVSFRHKSVTPKKIASELAQKNIFVWNGHNYALGIVQQLGIPEDEGVVRIGMAHYNTVDEVEQVIAAVKNAVSG